MIHIHNFVVHGLDKDASLENDYIEKFYSRDKENESPTMNQDNDYSRVRFMLL